MCRLHSTSRDLHVQVRSSSHVDTPLTMTYENDSSIIKEIVYPRHRKRIKKYGQPLYPCLVAKQFTKAEIKANPKAVDAMRLEYNKLENKKVWLEETVREWSRVAREAKRNGTKVHVGMVFGICVIKGSELPEGHAHRKYKGRYVFQGNQVRGENKDYAVF